MAFTQKDYADLCSAIALGAKFVKYADKEVEYRSLDEMQKLKRTMEGELGIGTGTRKRRSITVYDKGLSGDAYRRRTGSSSGQSTTAKKQVRSDAIIVLIKATPDDSTYQLRNGILIDAQYPEGNTINIPYLATPGVYVKKIFFLNGQQNSSIEYIQGSTTIASSAGPFSEPDKLMFEYEYEE